MPYKIDNSEIDPNNVITMMENVIITGSLGTEQPFLRLRQYVICSETTTPVTKLIECTTCDNDLEQVYYYNICIDGEEFLIPKEYAVIEGVIKTEYQQDLHKNWIKQYVDQPRDYKKVAKEVLGIEINTGNMDIANQEENDRIKKEKGKLDGRSYGTVSFDEMG